MPSFAIILTTYRRPELILRALESVFTQTYEHWELVVVNDSPDEPYEEAESLMNGKGQISYLRNDTNVGKNASVNRALNHLDQKGFQGHVVFFDDDDWLAPNCLADFADALKHKPDTVWLVSERARTDGTSFTKNKTGRHLINYFRDCLLLKRFSGDATHCMRYIEASKCRLLETVKNAEEWFFFSQLAQHAPVFTYLATVGTYSEGYLVGGLTHTTLSRREKIDLFLRISKELSRVRAWNTSTALYMGLRFGKILLS